LVVAHGAASSPAGSRSAAGCRRASITDGADLVDWARILGRLSEIVLDNLDALLESSYDGPVEG
jgi:hypothetical protein